MKHTILIEIDSLDGLDQAAISDLVNEVQSNLDWVERDYGIKHVTVVPLPTLVEDLTTLFISSQNSTLSIECAAALGNFTGELLEQLGHELPVAGVDFDAFEETDLDRFNLSKGGR